MNIEMQFLPIERFASRGLYVGKIRAKVFASVPPGSDARPKQYTDQDFRRHVVAVMKANLPSCMWTVDWQLDGTFFIEWNLRDYDRVDPTFAYMAASACAWGSEFYPWYEATEAEWLADGNKIEPKTLSLYGFDCIVADIMQQKEEWEADAAGCDTG